jgi:hypothetical protein
MIFLFPTNYKHGQPSKDYYRDSVTITSVSPRTQDFINDIFTITKLYLKFKNMSFKYYVDWIDQGYDVYLASPKIYIIYSSHCLKYFHVPKLYDVKYDFCSVMESNNKLSSERDLIIKGELEGNYIISLSN